MRKALLALAALSLACARQTPVQAYQSFVQAAQARDPDRIWPLLSKATQDRLDALAREASQSASGVVPDSGKRLLVGNAIEASVPVAPDGVKLLRESADRAIIRVTAEGGQEREVSLVREGGWRIDLVEILPGK